MDQNDQTQSQAPEAPAQPAQKKMTLLDAAATLLAEGKPMRCKEIVDAAVERGLWSPGTGKTPDRTLCAAFQRDAKRGESSRFVKVSPGVYNLRQA